MNSLAFKDGNVALVAKHVADFVSKALDLAEKMPGLDADALGNRAIHELNTPQFFKSKGGASLNM